MQDGLNLTLAISSANLIGVLGLAVRVWLKDRPQKLEQPIEVKPAASSTPREQCEERHGEILSWRDNMYGRVIRLENQQAAYEATQDAMKTQLSSMDGKLDRLIARKG